MNFQEIKRDEPFGSIDNIKFSFFSEDEIKNISVVEITDVKNDGPGSLYDLRMGPANQIEICETCGEDWSNCPGHFGYIKLKEPIPHPLCSKQILDFLYLFCFKCKRMILTEEALLLINAFNPVPVFVSVLSGVSGFS